MRSFLAFLLAALVFISCKEQAYNPPAGGEASTSVDSQIVGTWFSDNADVMVWTFAQDQTWKGGKVDIENRKVVYTHQGEYSFDGVNLTINKLDAEIKVVIEGDRMTASGGVTETDYEMNFLKKEFSDEGELQDESNSSGSGGSIFFEFSSFEKEQSTKL